jgi:TRAP-type C4-dicarboxylate transport system substrate-binding protein
MWNKKVLIVCFMFFSLYVASYGYAQNVDPKKVIKLKYSTYFAVTHSNSVLAADFCKEIKERTKGRVEIQFYAGGTLTTATKIYQGVVSGISDIGLTNISYNRGRFPATELLDLPLGFPSGYVNTHVVNDFYEKFKPKDFDKVHVLYLHACGPNVLYTVKKPVKTLDDLKGLKIGCRGRIADIAKALGATPVGTDIADYYEGMTRGVIDGAFNPMNTLKDWKLGEIVKYATTPWKVGSMYTFYVVINKDKWNSFPEDIKKIFNEVSAEWIERTGLSWNRNEIAGAKFLKDNGGSIITLSEQEMSKWQKAVEPVISGYIKELEKMGYKKNDIDSYINFLNERIAFWRMKEKEAGIKNPFN